MAGTALHRSRSSRYAEAALADRRFVGHADVIDVRPPGAGAAELDERLDVLRLTLEDRFDGAVGPVSHRARNTPRARAPLDRRPEADALHEPADDDAAADQPATDSSTASGMSKFA